MIPASSPWSERMCSLACGVTSPMATLPVLSSEFCVLGDSLTNSVGFVLLKPIARLLLWPFTK